MNASHQVDNDCDFCRIAQGLEPAEVICEGRDWLAFFPLHPATPGHTLVIPRVHIVDLWDADPQLGDELMAAVIKVGRAIRTALAPDGMNLITSAGSAAEQTIFHLHLHVVPRWAQDGFGQIWPADRHYEEPRLDNVAERIRQACHDDETAAP